MPAIGARDMTERTCSGRITVKEFVHQINNRPIMIVHHELSGSLNQLMVCPSLKMRPSAVILLDEYMFRVLAASVGKLLREEQAPSHQFVSYLFKTFPFYSPFGSFTWLDAPAEERPVIGVCWCDAEAVFCFHRRTRSEPLHAFRPYWGTLVGSSVLTDRNVPRSCY